MQKSTQLISHPRRVATLAHGLCSCIFRLGADWQEGDFSIQTGWLFHKCWWASSFLPPPPIPFKRVAGLGKKTAFWVSRMLRAGIQLFSLQFIYMCDYLMYNLLQINIGVFIARRLHPGTLCGSGNTVMSKKTQHCLRGAHLCA